MLSVRNSKRCACDWIDRQRCRTGNCDWQVVIICNARSHLGERRSENRSEYRRHSRCWSRRRGRSRGWCWSRRCGWSRRRARRWSRRGRWSVGWGRGWTRWRNTGDNNPARTRVVVLGEVLDDYVLTIFYRNRKTCGCDEPGFKARVESKRPRYKNRRCKQSCD